MPPAENRPPAELLREVHEAMESLEQAAGITKRCCCS
jgi:hypothetical protein